MFAFRIDGQGAAVWRYSRLLNRVHAVYQPLKNWIPDKGKGAVQIIFARIATLLRHRVAFIVNVVRNKVEFSIITGG